jgi:hypothetical protein
MSYRDLPRCGAYARSAGRPCQHCAMANGRCYYHGGASKIKHGKCTKQSIQDRRETKRQIKRLRDAMQSLSSTSPVHNFL